MNSAGPIVDPTFLGLKLYEWMTLIGVIASPIIAVAITLRIEGKRRTRDQQIQLMRMLLTTRHLAGDPAYTVAINSIPVEFDDSRSVMEAWRGYIATVRFRPSSENASSHHQDVLTRQTRLIFEITKKLGFSITEGEIQSTAYAADGMIQRDNLTIEAWRAWPRIADALEQNNRFVAGLTASEDMEK